MMESLRGDADLIIDSSGLTPHELRDRIRTAFADAPPEQGLHVSLVSFGFKYGAPRDADLVFDVRFLPNPHFVTSLRRWTGRHARVARYVLDTRGARRFLRLTTDLLTFLVPQYIQEGKAYLTIAIGCTGGRHRSVAIAEALAARLKRVRGTQIRVRHRDAEDL